MDVKSLCLGVLSLSDASGYEIKKCLEGPFKHFFTASFGSIYPALRALEADGLVTCSHEAQDSRPDKKVYRLAPQGRLTLLEAMAKPPAPDRVKSEFLVAMMFADLLPTRHVSDVIEERIAQYRATIVELEAIDHAGLPPGRRFVIGYGLSFYRSGLEYMIANRHLLEGGALLAAIDAARAAAAPAAE